MPNHKGREEVSHPGEVARKASDVAGMHNRWLMTLRGVRRGRRDGQQILAVCIRGWWVGFCGKRIEEPSPERNRTDDDVGDTMLFVQDS